MSVETCPYAETDDEGVFVVAVLNLTGTLRPFDKNIEVI